MGNWDAGLSYSLGRDATTGTPNPAATACPGESATDQQACRAYSAGIKYVTPAWGASVADDRQNGRTPGPAPDAVFGGLNSSGTTDSRLTVSGFVIVGGYKIGGGVLMRDNEGLAAAPRSNLYWLGTAVPVSAATTLSVQAMNLRYPGQSQRNSLSLVALLNHQLSKRTAVYAQVGRIYNNSAAAVSLSGAQTGSNPPAGVDQSGLNLGIRHVF